MPGRRKRTSSGRSGGDGTAGPEREPELDLEVIVRRTMFAVAAWQHGPSEPGIDPATGAASPRTLELRSVPRARPRRRLALGPLALGAAVGAVLALMAAVLCGTLF